MFDSFKDLLRIIYTSQIIKDIFYLTPEFEDFCFPFDDDDIFNELIDMTIFLPFPNDALHGFTEKEIPEVLIPTNLKKPFPYENDFSLIVCQLSQILNTCINEHVKHYLKALIFYNSFRCRLKRRINSNLFEIDEERNLINSILKKNKKKYKLQPIDGGEKAEIFLYGNILNEIYFAQSLELFKKSNWEKTIPQHIENFKQCKTNNQEDIKIIKLDEIVNDDDLCDFYKILVKKFKQYVLGENEEEVIPYNFKAFAGKNPGIISEQAQKGEIKYDYSYHIAFERGEKDASF